MISIISEVSTKLGQAQYLETHDDIVNRIGREISGIASENSMKNVFYRLRDRNLIEPVPGRGGFLSAWRKKR